MKNNNIQENTVLRFETIKNTKYFFMLKGGWLWLFKNSDKKNPIDCIEYVKAENLNYNIQLLKENYFIK